MASEIQRSDDLPPSRLSAWRTSQPAGCPVASACAECRQRAGRAATDPPTGAAVPEDDGAGAGFDGIKSADTVAVFDKKRTGLDEFAHGGGVAAAELLPAGDASGAGMGFIPNAAAKGGRGVPASGNFPGRGNEAERCAFRGEKSGVDRRDSTERLSCGGRVGIPGAGAARLIDYDEAVVTGIEGNALEGDSRDFPNCGADGRGGLQ